MRNETDQSKLQDEVEKKGKEHLERNQTISGVIESDERTAQTDDDDGYCYPGSDPQQ